MNPILDPILPTPASPLSRSGADGAGIGDGKYEVPPEVFPNIDELEIQDDEPVDSILVEKQQRLLTEPLYSSWSGPGEQRTFAVYANVGLFYAAGRPPLVPDVMLSCDVPVGADISVKKNQSYFSWIIGKMPDAVIEIVSDRRGGEDTHKLAEYARIGIVYYVVYDPDQCLGNDVLRVFGLHQGTYHLLPDRFMERIGLGLTFWQGTYEKLETQWLRWCDHQGLVIPTGNERADQQEQRVRQLEELLRVQGIEPPKT